MTPNPVHNPAPGPDLDLDQVRTSADVATWLLQRSAAFVAEATTSPAPNEARGLRNAASTLEVFATVLRDYPANPALAVKLSSMADGYLHPDRDAVETLPDHYRLARTHLGNTLDRLALHLLRTTQSLACTVTPLLWTRARPGRDL